MASLVDIHDRGPPEGPPAAEDLAELATGNPEASEGTLRVPGLGLSLLGEAGKPMKLHPALVRILCEKVGLCLRFL